jgi:hypothetical protein
LINEYYPQYLSHLADEGRKLPLYIQREFDDYLKCGLLEHGFLRVRCETCRYGLCVSSGLLTLISMYAKPVVGRLGLWVVLKILLLLPRS